MNTLQQIVDFTGVTSNAGQRVGMTIRDASMRSIGNIVTLLSNSERNSMRAMISRLEHLPPWRQRSWEMT